MLLKIPTYRIMELTERLVVLLEVIVQLISQRLTVRMYNVITGFDNIRVRLFQLLFF